MSFLQGHAVFDETMINLFDSITYQLKPILNNAKQKQGVCCIKLMFMVKRLLREGLLFADEMKRCRVANNEDFYC